MLYFIDKFWGLDKHNFLSSYTALKVSLLFLQPKGWHLIEVDTFQFTLFSVVG